MSLLRSLSLWTTYCLAAFCLSSPASANRSAYIQCVPFAREQANVQIYGDAHTWWGQSAGRYDRGQKPRIRSVMSFRPHGRMRLGHVAVVSKIIDSRNILLNHSNWSPVNGRRGQIERNVRAVDVSARNDWSKVKVWYAPIGAMGGTVYPIHGFIYSPDAPAQIKAPPSRWASLDKKTIGSVRQAERVSLISHNLGEELIELSAKEQESKTPDTPQKLDYIYETE